MGKFVTIRDLTLEDYEKVHALWDVSHGVGLSESDSPDQIASFLGRNPGFSLIAQDEDRLVGAVLCGHDGRRGYIHHLAVSESHRRRGIGRQLVDQCLSRLAKAGIQKCHLFVFKHNDVALAFWHSLGWTLRGELNMISKRTT